LQSGFHSILRHYRIGNASRGYEDENTTHHVLSFKGVGQRPYRVAHLKSRIDQGGDCLVSWIRRTRVDGDSWDSYEVPLGEGTERYQITVVSATGTALRSSITTIPSFVYTAAERVADAIAFPFSIEVSQISDSYGIGPVTRIEVD